MRRFLRCIGLLLLISCQLVLPAQPRLHVTPSDTLCGEEAETQIRRMWDELQDSWFARIAEYQINSQISMPDVVADSASVDSVNILRLQALLNTTVFPMVYNDEIRRYINLYTKGLKSMPLILARAQEYFPMFEETLDRYGVPLELKYLAVIESALRPDAVSRAKAKGLWQFMYGTGKLYGLEESTFVDDRFDPLKATDAAARHLYDLSEMFDGNWPLALAAYNCGPGNVVKAIKRAGGAQDFWQIYNYLPRETRGYVPAFYGAMFAMKYYRLYGLEAAVVRVEATDTLMIYKKLDFRKVSSLTGIPLDELKHYNPQYKCQIIPASSSGYALTLPAKYVPIFMSVEDSIYRMQQAEELARITLPSSGEETGAEYTLKNKYHVVKSGESLTMIARKYGTTVNRLLQLNHRKSTMIHPGERLIVGQTKVYKPVPKPAVTPSDTLKQPALADTLAPQPLPADSAKQEVMPLP
ncbi:MAG: transglycosylase SLT domain-containing protein [Bacteroidales bacterium]|nr:transglycosylase SLT domain-containing protein [Bacteroidales bacterium]